MPYSWRSTGCLEGECDALAAHGVGQRAAECSGCLDRLGLAGDGELAAEGDFAVGDGEVVRGELDVGVAGRVEELGREQVGPEVGLRDVDALDGDGAFELQLVG